MDLDLNINPDSQESPAMLNVIGHNQEAFRNKLYQIVYLNRDRENLLAELAFSG